MGAFDTLSTLYTLAMMYYGYFNNKLLQQPILKLKQLLINSYEYHIVILPSGC